VHIACGLYSRVSLRVLWRCSYIIFVPDKDEGGAEKTDTLPLITEKVPNQEWLQWGQELRVCGGGGMLDAKTGWLTDWLTNCQLQSDLNLLKRVKPGNLLTKWLHFYRRNTVPLICPTTLQCVCALLLSYVTSSVCFSVSFSLLVSILKCLKWWKSVVWNRIPHRQVDIKLERIDISFRNWQPLWERMIVWWFWSCLTTSLSMGR
jgi:hypothetical protein